MEQRLERLEQLIDASVQILEHMEIPGQGNARVKQLKDMLRHEYDQVASIRHQEADQQTLHNISSRLGEIQVMIDRLQEETLNTYEQVTDGKVDRFEAQTIAEQQDDPEGYHGKIDFNSAVKLQDNLAQMQRELSQDQ